MALFGVTRSFQLAIKIESRLILFPMAKKGFSLSGPVRYMPGPYTPTNKAQEASHLESSKKKVLGTSRRRSNGGKNSEEVLGYEDKRFQDRPSDITPIHAGKSNDLSAQLEDLLGAVREPCCEQVYYGELKNDSTFFLDEALNSGDLMPFAEDSSTNEVRHDEEQATDFLSARMQKALNSSDPARNLLGENPKIDSTHKDSYLQTFEKKGAHVVGERGLNCIMRANAIVSFNDETFHNRLDVDLEELCDLSGDLEEQFESVDAVDNASGILMEANSNSFRTTNVNEKITSEIRQTVEKAATDLLAARAFTVLELRKKLHAKRYPSAVIDSVLAEMKCRGLLNDGFYAESYARSRWLSSNWGPRRIKQVLAQKGVNSVDADKATRLVFEDDPSCSEGCTQFGMSKLSLERLFLQVSKQWKRGQDTSLENRKARVARWLQYRGFSWGVISLMLRKLQSQFPQ